jgi:hypothetical protein
MKVFARLLAAGCALAALAVLAAAITGSGKATTQSRQVQGFSGLGLSIPAIVEVGQAAHERLTITADDNVLPLIESVVEGGVLKLRLREGTQLRRATIRVSLQVKALESISISGSGEVRAPALSGPRLRLSIAGSGDARVGGKAEALDVRISGSGNVDAARLAAQRAAVSVSGSGDATVSARESLKVRIAGSGDVRYYGDPKVEKSVAGSGSLRRLGAAPS